LIIVQRQTALTVLTGRVVLTLAHRLVLRTGSILYHSSFIIITISSSIRMIRPTVICYVNRQLLQV